MDMALNAKTKRCRPRIAATRALAVAAYVVLSVLLHACGGSGSEAPANPPQASSGPGASPGPGPGPGGASIVAWGDSWTSGVGAVDGMSFPDQLRSLTARTVFNGGVSGQTSDQIAARQGGAPALLTLPGNTLPASGLVVIQDQSTFPVSAEGPAWITGTLSGIHGTLSFNGSNLVFQADQAGTARTVPPQSAFDPDTFGSQSEINVFWMGSNNFSDPAGVKSDIAKAVAFLSTGKFIVLGLLNAGSEPRGSAPYDQIIQLNTDLAASYPNNFLDIRAILVASYDPARPQDVADHANDVPPASLKNDDQHPNEAGYAIVAQQVAGIIGAKGW
jgi:lysophospholipase L1-like esterase